jgi:mono/diheme cytochrome c family protein
MMHPGIRHAIIMIMGIVMVVFMVMLSSCDRCSQKSTTSGETLEVSPEVKLLARGKLIYNANCISCHNRNPKLQGSVGPDVFGSSKELLTAKLLHGKYPDGYKPKRESHLMPLLPHLENEIEALTAFLNAKEL